MTCFFFFDFVYPSIHIRLTRQSEVDAADRANKQDKEKIAKEVGCYYEMCFWNNASVLSLPLPPKLS